jgi:hypothetical protein
MFSNVTFLMDSGNKSLYGENSNFIKCRIKAETKSPIINLFLN